MSIKPYLLNLFGYNENDTNLDLNQLIKLSLDSNLYIDNVDILLSMATSIQILNECPQVYHLLNRHLNEIVYGMENEVNYSNIFKILSVMTDKQILSKISIKSVKPRLIFITNLLKIIDYSLDFYTDDSGRQISSVYEDVDRRLRLNKNVNLQNLKMNFTISNAISLLKEGISLINDSNGDIRRYSKNLNLLSLLIIWKYAKIDSNPDLIMNFFKRDYLNLFNSLSLISIDSSLDLFHEWLKGFMVINFSNHFFNSGDYDSVITVFRDFYLTHNEIADKIIQNNKFSDLPAQSLKKVCETFTTYLSAQSAIIKYKLTIIQNQHSVDSFETLVSDHVVNEIFEPYLSKILTIILQSILKKHTSLKSNLKWLLSKIGRKCSFDFLSEYLSNLHIDEGIIINSLKLLSIVQKEADKQSRLKAIDRLSRLKKTEDENEKNKNEKNKNENKNEKEEKNVFGDKFKLSKSTGKIVVTEEDKEKTDETLIDNAEEVKDKVLNVSGISGLTQYAPTDGKSSGDAKRRGAAYEPYAYIGLKRGKRSKRSTANAIKKMIVKRK